MGWGAVRFRTGPSFLVGVRVKQEGRDRLAGQGPSGSAPRPQGGGVHLILNLLVLRSTG